MNIKKILNNINPEDVVFYLKRTGWILSDLSNDKYYWFKSSDNNLPIEILIPKQKTSLDFEHRIFDALKVISSFHNVSTEQIVNQINCYDRDFINLRVVDRNVNRGTIPLYIAERVIRSLNKLLKFAAAQAIQSKPYYQRPPEKAVNYAEGLRFAHTFEGSFGFVVESPLSLPTIGMPEIGIPAPYERIVVERVYDGLDIVERATKENSADIIVDNVMHGFNANMCEAIVEISEEIQAVSIAYNFAWSPIIPVTNQDKVSRIFHLIPGSYRVLEDASRQLKNESDELDTSITGSVTILKAPPGFLTHEDSLRLVTIVGSTDNGQVVNITTNLLPDDYKLACDAHRDGKFVIIKGHLIRGVNRRWEISGYSKFGIIGGA